MKELKFYRCSRCGTIYTNKRICGLCETGLKPVKIIDYDYGVPCLEFDGFPEYISIQFDGGSEARYALHSWNTQYTLSKEAEAYRVEDEGLCIGEETECEK